jgi:hypothetical protein
LLFRMCRECEELAGRIAANIYRTAVINAPTDLPPGAVIMPNPEPDANPDAWGWGHPSVWPSWRVADLAGMESSGAIYTVAHHLPGRNQSGWVSPYASKIANSSEGISAPKAFGNTRFRLVARICSCRHSGGTPAGTACGHHAEEATR